MIASCCLARLPELKSLVGRVEDCKLVLALEIAVAVVLLEGHSAVVHWVLGYLIEPDFHVGNWGEVGSVFVQFRFVRAV